MRMTLNQYLLLSLALHGVLLALYRPQPQLSVGVRPLTVALVGGERHAPSVHSPAPAMSDTVIGHIPTATAHTRTYTTRRHTPLRHTTLANTAPRVAIVPSVASAPAHPSVRPGHGTSSNPSLTAEEHTTLQTATGSNPTKTAAWLQTRLLNAFASNFDYPMLARRHGWEGQLKLALRIEPDGRVSHLQLAQSSGYAALDEAALASARRIEILDDVATRLHGVYFDMVLPIEYRLLGG